MLYLGSMCVLQLNKLCDEGWLSTGSFILSVTLPYG